MAGKVETYENPWKFKAVGVNYDGTKITLPALPVPMELPDAIEELHRLQQEAETLVDVHEPIDAFPLEGAAATMRVLKRMFGWTRPVPKMTFFGPQRPTMVNMPTGFGTSVQVIWGDFELPGLEGGNLSTGRCSHESEDRSIFCLGGEVKRKFQPSIREIAEAIRKEVRENSLYQGKAIELALDDEDGEIEVDWNRPPKFLDTSDAKPDELVFNEDVMNEVRASLFNPIQFTERCRKHGVPLKRGILLAGPYGTGKTLTAQIVAQMCEAHNWTYIYLKDVRALDGALMFARRYQPAVVFAEDVDRAIASKRTSEVDRVLNTIDGMDAKHNDVITILTTNKVEEINQAMLRPGRLDSVINLCPPDAEAVATLIGIYARGLLKKGEPLNEVGELMQGNIPAVIREVVERAKLHAITNAKNGLVLTQQNLVHAAQGMKQHLELLKQKGTELNSAERLGMAFTEVTEDVVKGNGQRLIAQVAKRTARELSM